MTEGSWLCLVLVLPNFKRFEEDKNFMMKKDSGFHLKSVETFLSRNLLPDKPAKRFSKFC